jgi:hypothetical protein
METESIDATTAPTTVAVVKQKPSIVLPEVDLYIHLLVVLFSIDNKKHKQVCF